MRHRRRADVGVVHVHLQRALVRQRNAVVTVVKLEREILRLPGTGLNGSAARAANTTNIWFDNLEGEALVIAMDLKGVAVSGGSACLSGRTEPSHVLLAMGVNVKRARTSLRFSLLKMATEEDVDYVTGVVPDAVERLRAVSPVEAGTLG